METEPPVFTALGPEIVIASGFNPADRTVIPPVTPRKDAVTANVVSVSNEASTVATATLSEFGSGCDIPTDVVGRPSTTIDQVRHNKSADAISFPYWSFTVARYVPRLRNELPVGRSMNDGPLMEIDAGTGGGGGGGNGPHAV